MLYYISETILKVILIYKYWHSWNPTNKFSRKLSTENEGNNKKKFHWVKNCLIQGVGGGGGVAEFPQRTGN